MIRGTAPPRRPLQPLCQGLSNPREPSLLGRRHFRTIQILPKDLPSGSVAG
jgi:hypothetical protein